LAAGSRRKGSISLPPDLDVEIAAAEQARMSYTTSLADTARKEITIRPSLNAISSHETNTVPSPGGELRWSFAVGIGRGIGGADKPGGVAVGGGVVAGKGNLSARTAALRYLAVLSWPPDLPSRQTGTCSDHDQIVTEKPINPRESVSDKLHQSG
jgi:hypothetical protein